ncbi:hypothetical protein EYR41_010847 [Orbilia oligospora]|uniref:Uncharacterized protein n=1 Tax=Orbilia oligospora TaxID=2813651 RepID=A0A8H2HFE6_ORBOL|nr:hypothetical protein EYR41_010847 [Orbilia oligospora]
MTRSPVPFVKTNGSSHPGFVKLEDDFTTDCGELLTLFRKKPATYQRMMKLIKLLNKKVGELDAEKGKLAAEEAAIPTIEDLIPNWVRVQAPPSIAAASSCGISTMSCRSGTQRATPLDPIRYGSKTYQIPDLLPRRPFYLPVVGNPGAAIFYFGPRDGHEIYARLSPWDTFAPPKRSVVAGSGRQLRFAELPAHFVRERSRFKFLWEGLAACRRVEACCGDVESHRRGFTDPNKLTREEAKRGRQLRPWLDNMDHARMKVLDKRFYPVSVATGPPVLIGGQSEASGQSELTDDNVPEEGIVVRPSELQKYLDELTERLERRLEQLVGEVRTAAAGRANLTGPPPAGGSPSVQARATDTPATQGPRALASGREPSVYGSSDSGGSQGPNLWVYTPAMTEGDGGSFCHPSESGPDCIMDSYDDGHLRLGFPPLVPATLWGTYPSDILPRLTWPLQGGAIDGDNLIAL